jgi:hypothetical protein
MNFHLGLSRDVYPSLKDNLRDQACEWKSCRILILGLQHSIEDMLAQAKQQPHDNGIYKLSPLLNQITSTNNRPEIVLDNLCE